MTTTRPDFEVHNGVKYPIIWRKKGQKETDACPFCKCIHTHGIGEGHRVSHCGDSFNSERQMDSARLSDGTYIPPRLGGYILREY